MFGRSFQDWKRCDSANEVADWVRSFGPAKYADQSKATYWGGVRFEDAYDKKASRLDDSGAVMDTQTQGRSLRYFSLGLRS